MPTLWADTLPNMTVALGVGGITSVDLLTNFDFRPGRADRMTLTRTIIGIDIARTVHDSGEGSEQVFLGIGVIGKEAFLAGGTAIPDPFDPTEWPARGWIWKAAYRVFGFAADQPAVFNVRVDLDIRAQRKLENGTCFITAHNTIFEGSNSTINVSGLIRQLWLV